MDFRFLFHNPKKHISTVSPFSVAIGFGLHSPSILLSHLAGLTSVTTLDDETGSASEGLMGGEGEQDMEGTTTICGRMSGKRSLKGNEGNGASKLEGNIEIMTGMMDSVQLCAGGGQGEAHEAGNTEGKCSDVD